MRLRHLILLTTAAGGGTALFLAVDFQRRLHRAEHDFLLRQQPPGLEFFTQFGVPHAAGLWALAFVFFALFLLLLMGSRESVNAPAEAAAKDGREPASPSLPNAVQPPPAGQAWDGASGDGI